MGICVGVWGMCVGWWLKWGCRKLAVVCLPSTHACPCMCLQMFRCVPCHVKIATLWMHMKGKGCPLYGRMVGEGRSYGMSGRSMEGGEGGYAIVAEQMIACWPREGTGKWTGWQVQERQRQWW